MSAGAGSLRDARAHGWKTASWLAFRVPVRRPANEGAGDEPSAQIANVSLLWPKHARMADVCRHKCCGHGPGPDWTPCRVMERAYSAGSSGASGRRGGATNSIRQPNATSIARSGTALTIATPAIAPGIAERAEDHAIAVAGCRSACWRQAPTSATGTIASSDVASASTWVEVQRRARAPGRTARRRRCRASRP